VVEPTDQVSVVISQGDEADFNDDSVVRLAGGDIGGEIVIYVNDSPCFIHVFGGGLLPITPLLERGRNEIRFEGSHTARMYAKVILTGEITFDEESGFEIKKVYGKNWLLPEEQSGTITFELDDHRMKPVYDLLVDDPASRERQRAQIMGLLREMKEAWNQRDGERLWKLLNLELVATPWGPLLSTDTLRQRKRDVIEFVNRGQYEWVTPLDELKMIFGRRTVLVYHGSETDLFGPYLFKGRDRETHQVDFKKGPLLLARVNRMWVILRL